MDSTTTQSPYPLEAAIAWFASLLGTWYYAAAIYLALVTILLIVCLCYTQPPDRTDASPQPDIERGDLARATPDVPVATFAAWTRPVREFKDIGEVGDVSCAICLDDFKASDGVDAPFSCKHVFHRVCIDLWLERSILCPLCRSFARFHVKGIAGDVNEVGTEVRSNSNQ